MTYLHICVLLKIIYETPVEYPKWSNSESVRGGDLQGGLEH